MGNDNMTQDAQHKKLQTLCQQANLLMTDDSPASKERFHLLLNDLACYARTYFAAKEEKLRQTHPELLASYCAEQIAQESQLTDLLISASAGLLDKRRLHRFLTEWSASLIRESDMGQEEAQK